MDDKERGEYQLVSNIEIIIVLYFSFDFKIASQTNRKQYLFAQNSYQTLKVHTHYTYLRTSFFLYHDSSTRLVQELLNFELILLLIVLPRPRFDQPHATIVVNGQRNIALIK